MDCGRHEQNVTSILSITHESALIPKGVKAGDLRRCCEGLNLWNSWGNYCAAPKSVGSQTTNGDSSRSQHGELILLPGPEGRTNSMLTPNYASIFLFGEFHQRKSQIQNELPVSMITLDDANHQPCEMTKQPALSYHEIFDTTS